MGKQFSDPFNGADERRGKGYVDYFLGGREGRGNGGVQKGTFLDFLSWRG